jgi:sodium transport system ATP-binding protein
MIHVRDLRKRYGAVTALDGVSFSAPDGAITGLLGANGAGKTTTMAIVCGLLRPDGGNVGIDGRPALPVERRHAIGALLDHQGLYGRLTVHENIAYFAELQGLPGRTCDDAVDRAIAQLDLAPLAGRRAAGLSQGERMKVALARAIVHAPRHLLLDEPTNGLDVPAIRGLRAQLRRLRDEGRCIMFSSHVLQEVRALCDRVVVIAGGRVVAERSVDAIGGDRGAEAFEDAFVSLIAGRRPA